MPVAPVRLQWLEPGELAGPGELRDLFWSERHPTSRAALYLRAARSALLAEDGRGAAPGLGPETVAAAREAAHAILADLGALLPLALRAARSDRYRPRLADARAWPPAERRRLACALARVVGFIEAEVDDVREVLAMLDADGP